MIISTKTTLTFLFLFNLFFVNPYDLSAQSDAGPNKTSIYELPVGTIISVQMDNEINSKSSSVNDTFTARVSEPVMVKEVSVLAAGSIIEGRILDVSSAASGGKGGILEVRFEKVTLATGQTRRIEGVLVTKLKARSSKKKSLFAIIGGTAIGAVIGVASKSGSGALIGSGLGAGVGLGTTLFMKGKEVRIKADEVFQIKLTKKVVLPPEGF